MRKSEEGWGEEPVQEFRKPGILPLATAAGVAALVKVARRRVRVRRRGWWGCMVSLDLWVEVSLYVCVYMAMG